MVRWGRCCDCSPPYVHHPQLYCDAQLEQLEKLLHCADARAKSSEAATILGESIRSEGAAQPVRNFESIRVRARPNLCGMLGKKGRIELN